MSIASASEVYSSPNLFTEDCKNQFKCRAISALIYLIIYGIVCLSTMVFIQAAAVFSGSFLTWVICNHVWFFTIVVMYLYYGFNYKFTPGDSWPRIQLDIFVFFGCVAMGIAGLTLIETDKFLSIARGKASLDEYTEDD